MKFTEADRRNLSMLLSDIFAAHKDNKKIKGRLNSPDDLGQYLRNLGVNLDGVDLGDVFGRLKDSPDAPPITFSFPVGAQIVCVGVPNSRPPFPGERYPVEGRIYTVRNIDREYGGIRLREIRNPKVGGGELGFHPHMFRRVTRTNISTFMEMLKRTPAANKSELKKLQTA